MGAGVHIDMSLLQGGNRGLKMGSISGFDHDFEDNRLGRQIREDALMGYLDDIGAGLAQDGNNRGELTGPVHDVEPQPRQTALPRKLTRAVGPGARKPRRGKPL